MTEQWILLGAAMLATGCLAGVMAGLFGIGGGIVIVPVLELALGFVGVDPAIRMHVAVGTSLATIIPTSISSAWAHHQRQAVDMAIVKRWAFLVLAGALLGAWIAAQLHSRVLAIIFATLALLIAREAKVTADREVAVLIRDRSSGKPLFEARASNEGNTMGNAALVQAMFEAALTDFPRQGVNPRKVVVSLP